MLTQRVDENLRWRTSCSYVLPRGDDPFETMRKMMRALALGPIAVRLGENARTILGRCHRTAVNCALTVNGEASRLLASSVTLAKLAVAALAVGTTTRASEMTGVGSADTFL